MAELAQSPNPATEAAAPAAATTDSAEAQQQPEPLRLTYRFAGKEYALELPAASSVGDLKNKLVDETAVPTKRQKLMGLVKGALPADDQPLAPLLAGKKSFMLMGTPDDKLFVDPADRDDLPEVEDDLAIDYDYTNLTAEWHRSKRNAATLAKFSAKTEINWITPKRPGKRLLVLDLDHTLLDFSRRDAEPALRAKRPHMDRFLELVYEHFDIAIWSQTTWRWLEVKLTELGMLRSSAYKICFVLDKTSMFKIVSKKRDGSEFKHAIKPLQLIWDKTDWTAADTVHVDDLKRNFALNPKNGIKCAAYHRDRPGAAGDVELVMISAYLTHIATTPGGMELDHSKWKDKALALMARRG